MNKKNRLLCLLSLTLTLSLSAQEIKLGTQTWAKANLNVSTFRNGDTIQEAKTATEWKTTREQGKPAWCYYDNDTANSRTI